MKNQMNIGDQITVKIESLVHGGDGLARHEGRVIFVQDVLAGEELKIRISSLSKDFAQGEPIEIIKPSPFRIASNCSISEQCGGCQWRHIAYEEQLQAKTRIIKESFKRVARLDVDVQEIVPNIQPDGYRSKVQLPVQQDKETGDFIIGYYKKRSHESVNMDSCPVQPVILDKLTDFIRNLLNQSQLTAYDRLSRTGLIRHIVYRYSWTDKHILCIFVVSADTIPDELKGIAHSIKSQFTDVSGILVNFNTQSGSVIFGNQIKSLLGDNSITEELDSKTFKISALSFFQINLPMSMKLFNIVRDIVSRSYKDMTLLDIYSGVASFSVWLGDLVSDVVAVEENPSAVKDALYNTRQNKLGHQVKLLNGTAELVLDSLVEGKESFDITLLDPPRSGCSKPVIKSVIQLTKKVIIYVSCDPVTLARDSKHFIDAGFELKLIQPVDLFSHSFHVETVAVLEKV